MLLGGRHVDHIIVLGRRHLGCLPPTAGWYSQYDKLDMYSFARFLKAAVRRFGKICLMHDSTPHSTMQGSSRQGRESYKVGII